YVYPTTTYEQAKRYLVSAETVLPGFFRSRQPTAEEGAIADRKWSDSKHPARGASIRPATVEEVGAYRKLNRVWSIAEEANRITSDTCKKLAISKHADSERIEQATEETVRRLRRLGWLDELVELDLKRSCEVEPIDDERLKEMMLLKQVQHRA